MTELEEEQLVDFLAQNLRLVTNRSQVYLGSIEGWGNEIQVQLVLRGNVISEITL